jgi:hypothetical protein
MDVHLNLLSCAPRTWWNGVGRQVGFFSVPYLFLKSSLKKWRLYECDMYLGMELKLNCGSPLPAIIFTHILSSSPLPTWKKPGWSKTIPSGKSRSTGLGNSFLLQITRFHLYFILLKPNMITVSVKGIITITATNNLSRTRTFETANTRFWRWFWASLMYFPSWKPILLSILSFYPLLYFRSGHFLNSDINIQTIVTLAS